MKRRPRRRRPTLGSTKGRVSLRWELGAPLLLMGVLVAAFTLGVRGGGLIFWGGALLAGVGLAIFLERT